MRVTRTELAGFKLTVWEEPSRQGAVSQDSWLGLDLGQRLRLAVIDGVTPTQLTPTPAGENGAVWAAGIVRTALSTSSNIRRAAETANGLLHRPELPGRSQTSAAFIAATLDRHGLSVLQGGDCEVWVRGAGGWRQLLAESILRPEAEQAITTWRQTNPTANPEEMYEQEERLLSDPQRWRCAGLGRFRVPILRAQRAARPFELVLASDGARLTAERLADLPGWMNKLRDWEEHELPARMVEKRHDDVTVAQLLLSATTQP